MSIPRDDYYEYRDMIQRIVDRGNKEALEDLYKEIRAKYGMDDDLKQLDKMYNSKWSIL